MILTDKSKQDFVKWCKQDASWLQTYEDIFLFALIIEWMDSVGYHICIEPHIGGGADVYYAKIIYRSRDNIDMCRNVRNPNFTPSDYYFSTRQNATKQAIIKANELYNKRGN